MSTPYQSPISQPAESRASLPLGENLLFAVVALGSAAYAVVCVVRIVTLNSIIGFAKQVAAGNPPSAATVQSKLNLDSHLNTAVNVTFWVMYLLFIAWMLMLNSRFRNAGQAGALRKMPAWIAWRVGVIVSLILVLVLRNSSNGSDISDLHHEMLYLGVRAIIGALYVWVALSMRSAALALSARTAGPRPGIPGQPLAYPTPTESAPFTGTDPIARD